MGEREDPGAPQPTSGHGEKLQPISARDVWKLAEQRYVQSIETDPHTDYQDARLTAGPGFPEIGVKPRPGGGFALEEQRYGYLPGTQTIVHVWQPIEEGQVQDTTYEFREVEDATEPSGKRMEVDKIIMIRPDFEALAQPIDDDSGEYEYDPATDAFSLMSAFQANYKEAAMEARKLGTATASAEDLANLYALLQIARPLTAADYEQAA